MKKTLRPVVAHLARSGVTANRVAVVSLYGSMVVGALLCVFTARPVLFAILRIWLAAQTACATLDGTLAIEFGQKSRLGGVLNEAGDIVSEISLFLPLALVFPLSTAEIIFLVSLVVASELAGKRSWPAAIPWLTRDDTPDRQQKHAWIGTASEGRSTRLATSSIACSIQ